MQQHPAGRGHWQCEKDVREHQGGSGPYSNKNSPIEKQVWRGHHRPGETAGALGRALSGTVVTDAALPDLPVMVELDEPPTLEELSKTIDSLASGKSPGADGISAEILKTGKAVLLEPLHQLLCLSWKLSYIPQDMRDANIVNLYKNKGERSDSSYWGISLLSIVGKAFARVVLTRLQSLAEQIYP